MVAIFHDGHHFRERKHVLNRRNYDMFDFTNLAVESYIFENVKVKLSSTQLFKNVFGAISTKIMKMYP